MAWFSESFTCSSQLLTRHLCHLKIPFEKHFPPNYSGIIVNFPWSQGARHIGMHRGLTFEKLRAGFFQRVDSSRADGVRSKSQKLESTRYRIEINIECRLNPGFSLLLLPTQPFSYPVSPFGVCVCVCPRSQCACVPLAIPLCFSIFSSSCYTSSLSLSFASDRRRAREFDGFH